MFFAIGFETTAPANAMAVWMAQRAAADELQRAGLARAGAAGDDAPSSTRRTTACRASSARATSAPSWAATSTSRSPRRYRVPIVITGFEPLDLLEGRAAQSVRQLEAGRAEVENQYGRAVRPRGQPGVAEADRRRSSRSATASGAASAPSPASGYRLRAEYRDHDAERRFEVATIETQESSVCISGQILRGAEEAARLPRVRQGVHAADAARRDDGVGRGGLRRVLRLRPASRRPCRSTMRPWPSDMPTTRHRVADLLGTCPLPLTRYDRVLLGHGSGGRLTAGTDPPPVPAGLRQRGAVDARRPGESCSLAPQSNTRHRLHHRLLRGPAALLPRRRHRPAGGPRHRQRPGRRRRPAAVSVGRVHPRRRAAARTTCSGSSASMRAGLRRGGRDAGHRRHQGGGPRQGRQVFITTSGIGLVPEGRSLSHPRRPARRPHPRLGHASATTASPSCRCARGSSSRPCWRATPPRSPT